ncbi:hypothetical protein [Humibacter ginsenosidimutans]|uniref:Uncharacterized protein n=1 Tax=Humibacter ginsenosidimutans TaxID=2599293 RepID=A0A5B8M5T0_9MICO|nr:hypothetical protein [Humibacter ginsenosidimutans]QDZ15571.1 hypothetical protein FPZ11_13090 [Humibacter ginsenosidimutans]
MVSTLQGAAVSIGIVFYAVVIALGLWVASLVIRAAVRNAMDDHYRKVQWYQATGLWYGGRPPKGLPGASELSRGERNSLPKDERPEA